MPSNVSCDEFTLRPGDILTHRYSSPGNNAEQNGKVLPALLEAKKRVSCEEGRSLCNSKNGMDDFRRNDNLMRAIHDVSGKMSNDKSMEVKHATPELSRSSGRTQGVAARRREDSLDRPRLLAERVRLQSDHRKLEMDDVALETFTLPLEAARLEVRAIIADISCGYQKIVERWRQLPDGRIEFTMRRLPTAD